jgi:hypothetical protein
MIRVSSELVGTQVESAVSLLQIYVQEASFWEYLEMWVSNTNLSQHDILEKDSDILTHLRCMFNCDLNIEIRRYATKNPFSKVIGYAQGNRVYENRWFLDKMTLHQRVGHLGHEICHLFGYHHEYQGQKTSVAVVFGKCLESYAEKRLKARVIV